jgi:glycosyltransferase involved in cell wall biosynthesis
MRASLWLSALSPHARVALVAPAGEVPSSAPRVDFYPAKRSFASGLRRAFAILRRDLPFQTLLAAPYEWDDAIAAARRDLGPFDAAIVVLSRVDPWVRESVKSGVRILDAVDSLRRNAAERGRAAPAMTRWFWRGEERRLARAEEKASRAYDRIVVVSEDDRREFGSTAMVIPISIRVSPIDAGAPRAFDFGFWGRLPYFANADAARWLIDEIWPAIRRRHPSATLAIAGADAPAAIRRAAKKAGVALFSPVDEISAFARSVRVAVIPMRYGSGQSNKVLEAAEAGCAIVAAPMALRALPQFMPLTSVAEDARGIANAAVELLIDERLRNAMAVELRRAVAADFDREDILIRLAEIAGIRAGEGVPA